jgi:hypothetical protein
MSGNSEKLIFPPGYSRITPQTKEELLACEPIEIARMIEQVRKTGFIVKTVESRRYRRCITRIDNFDLSAPVFIPDGLLRDWVSFLTNFLQWRENMHDETIGFKHEQQRQRCKKILNKLKGTRAFNIYLERDEVVENLLLWNKTPQDLLSLDTANLTDLLEADRWCSAYTRLLNNPALQTYCTANGFELALIDKFSFLQLAELADTLTAFEQKQQLIELINSRFPNWREMIQNHPNYLRAQSEPLVRLATGQLNELLRELESLSQANIGFDDTGQLIAKSPQ